MLVNFELGIFKLLPIKSINFYTNFCNLLLIETLYSADIHFIFFLGKKKSPDNEKIFFKNTKKTSQLE